MAAPPRRTPRFVGASLLALLGLWGGQEAAAGTVNVTTNVTASTVWQSSNTYILGTIIYVTNNATLTIEPGTVIRGKADADTPGANDPGTLIVSRGAKLVANGTPELPIVFTDMDDDNIPGGAKTDPLYNNNPNSNLSERWGGLVLLGRTYVANNTVAAPALVELQIEGVPGSDATYGGTDDDDDSGQLSYLSIRYGGSVLAPAKEINGLSMGAVGRNTEIHHIEVMNNVDDAFEWFGGTVNSKHLIAWNCGDDGLDSDMGYRGKVQFALVVKGACKASASNESGLSNRGMEIDGGEVEALSQPYALSQWRNLTLIGMDNSYNQSNDQGIMIRDNARPQIYHSIVMDMGGVGADVTDANSRIGWTTAWNAAPVAGAPAGMYTGQAQGFQTEIADCLFWNITAAVDKSPAIGILTDATKQNSVASALPIRAIGRQAAAANGTLTVVGTLDPRASGQAQVINKALTPEGFFDTVSYRGAFGPAGNWAEGWTLMGAMGVLYSEATGSQIVVSADISTSTTWEAENTYVLNGLIYVRDGATLTIEPGTVIRGLPDSDTPGTNDPGTLIVSRGAKIIANGTAELPIVFTDMDDDNVPGGAKLNPLYNNNPNSNVSENWGGLVLLGRTYVANDTVAGPALVELQIEGVPGSDATFGGTNDDDDSGELSHLSIRYGGSVLAPAKEINGLTMGAVGRGTSIHHIEVMNNVDDGFEWFGGTVNSKHLIAWNCGDDGFDSDMGYRGKVQFGLVVKGACKASASNESGFSNRGMEIDGGEVQALSQPYALSQWRNLTLVGMAGTGNASNDEGIKVRDNARPQIYHSIIMDMGDYGADIEGATGSQLGWTTAWNAAPVAGAPAGMYSGQAQGFQTEIADCLFYGIANAVDQAAIGILTDATKQNSVAATRPVRTVTRSAATGNGALQIVSLIDPRATAVAQGLNKVLAAESFFDLVDYRGAFGPSSNWAAGWSLIDDMGVLDTSAPIGTEILVSDDISASTTWESQNTYVLNGIIYVTNGATLTIEPGTVIRGMPDSETPGTNDPGTLIVSRGAKIVANGTAELPIVFTDMDDDNVPGGAKTNPLYNNNPNSNVSENWGGLVLLGRTYVANDTVAGPALVELQIEGVPGSDATFGGTNDDDDSGDLSYLSIRYGGSVLAPAKEINGLSMGAVGRGTSIHHIEVMNNVDDAFEWFGGTVNSKYLVAWNCGDDGLDSDMGYRGKVQFALVVKGACKASASNESGFSNRGMEIDGGEAGALSQPYALSQWRNLTLIGMAGTGNASNDEGIKVRDNARPQIYHSIVMGMGDYGADIEGASGSQLGWTTAWNAAPVAGAPAGMYTGQAQGFQTEIADCLFYGIANAVDVANLGILTDPTKQNSVTATTPITSLTRIPAVGNTLQVVNTLDPRATGVAQGVNKVLAAESFFDLVDYRGAFAAGDTWADAWTLISAMGVLTPASTGVTQTINLVQGWNWVSFNTIPADNSLENMLASYGPQDNDEFKTAGNLGGSATYFGGTWFGIEAGIQPGIMYLLKKQAVGAAVISVTGAPAPSVGIPLTQGWNWVGFTGRAITPVNTAMGLWSPTNATDNDELKTAGNLGGSATYFGGTWFGIDVGMKPGVGYKMKVQKAGPAPLTFGQ